MLVWVVFFFVQFIVSLNRIDPINSRKISQNFDVNFCRIWLISPKIQVKISWILLKIEFNKWMTCNIQEIWVCLDWFFAKERYFEVFWNLYWHQLKSGVRNDMKVILGFEDPTGYKLQVIWQSKTYLKRFYIQKKSTVFFVYVRPYVWDQCYVYNQQKCYLQ